MGTKNFSEEIVSIVKQVSSADGLQSFFVNLYEEPEDISQTRGVNENKILYQQLLEGEFNNLPYEQFFCKLVDASVQESRCLRNPDNVVRLAAAVAVSYLDARYAFITHALKEQGAYGKSIAKNLFSDSKALARHATEFEDILVAFEYAFHAGSEIARAVQQLDETSSVFRAGEKKVSDIFALVMTVKSAPWAVQKAFLAAEENSDIADFVRHAHTSEFEQDVFKDIAAAGEELFKKTGFTDKAQELLAVIQELGQAEEKYVAGHAELCDREYTPGSDSEETKRLAAFRELKNKIDVLEAKKQDIFLRIKRGMLQHSSISPDEAVKWVKDKVTFNPYSIKNILCKWYNVIKPSCSNLHDGTPDTMEEELAYIYHEANTILNKIKSELANIYRITNGRIDNIKINVADLNGVCDRTLVYKEGNIIHWPKADFGALYHEAGHVFEYENPWVLGPAMCFVKDRATGCLQKLADLMESRPYDDGDDDYDDYDDDEPHYSVYDDDEMAFPGRYSSPYVGKVYAGATEVMSTGLEVLGDAERFLSGIKDLEHLNFCFGCFVYGPLEDVEMHKADWDFKKADFARKTEAWLEALDNAMPGSFAERLFSKRGFFGFKIIEKVSIIKETPYLNKKKLQVIRSLLLKYDKKIIAKKNDSDDDLKKLARIAYLAICNLQEIIPHAFPIIDVNYLEKLSCNPPKWFTPITELPRL